MNIIIAGATGLIGTKLVESLLQEKHQITLISRNALQAISKFGNRVKAITWDMPVQQMATILSQQDAIINLAGEGVGEKKWTDLRKEQILNSRINSIQKLTTALALANKKPSVVLQASAIGYYGSTENAVNENSEHGSGFLADVCLKWEKAAQQFSTFDMRTVILRTGVVLTPDGGALKQFILPFSMFAGGPIGSGKQYISWIHIDDQIRAMLFLLKSATANGIYNLTAPNPVSMSEFTNALGKAMNRPSWLRVPGIALKLTMGQMADEMVLQGQQVVPQKLLTDGFQFEFIHIQNALSNLLNK